MTAVTRLCVGAALLVSTGLLAACGSATTAGDPAGAAISSTSSTAPAASAATSSAAASAAAPSAAASSSADTGLPPIAPGGKTTRDPGHSSSHAAKDLVVTSPRAGATVTGTLVLAGRANSPEGNVPWLIRSAAGKVVRSGAATASGSIDKLYPFRKAIDVSGLAAGSYTLEVSIDNEADAGEASGSGTSVPFTVK